MSNISKQKREKMLEYLKKLKEINNDDENIRTITEIENAINEKKYGLVWEKHTEKVDEMLEHHIPIFVEDKKRKIQVNEKEDYNFLLEGDNLHSLKLLEKTHKGKIDVIYIDPPYNTGNKDFIYNDSYVDKTDGYSHSKWLSFMSERLEIAKELLSEEGVIFISIDDNEQAQLKLLCDEMFGEENFVSKICVQTGEVYGNKSAHVDKTFVKVKDYVFVYYKQQTIKSRNILYDVNNKFYDGHFSIFYDNNKKNTLKSKLEQYIWIVDLFNKYKKQFNEEGINFILNIDEKFKNFFINDIANKIYQDQPYTKEIAAPLINLIKNNEIVNIDNKLVFKTSNNSFRMLDSYLKKIGYSDSYFNTFGRLNIRGDLWKDFHIDMRNITKEGNIEFRNGKKPVRLIKQLIKWSNMGENATILDFFAGSGTTGHAVMQLNKEDGGNRRYILCTNNENNICEEVTYQRLKNIQSELPHNLKYFKTDFISKYEDEEDEESISEKMLEHIKELIELEHHIEIDDNKYIILDDEEHLEAVIEKISKDGKIFISSGIFLTRSQQRILNEKQVSIIEIPEYYFRNELKEIGEI